VVPWAVAEAAGMAAVGEDAAGEPGGSPVTRTTPGLLSGCHAVVAVVVAVVVRVVTVAVLVAVAKAVVVVGPP
jgi:hypothetical protein